METKQTNKRKCGPPEQELTPRIPNSGETRVHALVRDVPHQRNACLDAGISVSQHKDGPSSSSPKCHGHARPFGEKARKTWDNSNSGLNYTRVRADVACQVASQRPRRVVGSEASEFEEVEFIRFS